MFISEKIKNIRRGAKMAQVIGYTFIFLVITLLTLITYMLMSAEKISISTNRKSDLICGIVFSCIVGIAWILIIYTVRNF